MTIGIVLLLIAVIVLGISLGMVERRYKQKHYCLKCSCRERCNIGHSVTGNDEIVGCCLCMGHGKED